jgi:hypothetical protein
METPMRPQHPSGKPIRSPKIGIRSIWRIPDKGSVLPRLQAEERQISAIGFTAEILARDDDE